MRIFGREPAVWLGLFAVCVQFVSAFWVDVDAETQAAVNATAAALMGLIVAAMVHDGVVAALTGFAQSALALGMHFGLDWSAEQQAALMAFITVVAQAFVRTQVVAPITAEAVPAPKRPVRGV